MQKFFHSPPGSLENPGAPLPGRQRRHQGECSAAANSASLQPHAAPAVILQALQPLQHILSNYHSPQALEDMLCAAPQMHARYLEHLGMERPTTGKHPEGGGLERALRREPAHVVRRFLLAMALDAFSEEPEARDVALVAIQRGRFMELLAEEAPAQASGELLFLAGCLSTLDVLCGMPLEDVLQLLDPPAEVYGLFAGLEAEGSACSDFLHLAASIEEADWAACDALLQRHGLDGERAAMLYGKASIWTRLLFD